MKSCTGREHAPLSIKEGLEFFLQALHPIRDIFGCRWQEFRLLDKFCKRTR